MNGLFPSVDDLEITGVNGDVFVRRTLIGSVVALAGAIGVILLVSATVSAPPLALSLLLVVGAPVLAWVGPTGNLHRRAEMMRADMDLAVAVFLDLVNVLLAGGAGVETAMLASAAAGDGWAFDRIRLALARAQSSRRSYWDALSELGAHLRVDSLEDVAHSVQLAGEHGARIRQSLAAKAHALRTRNLARIEHEAEQRTEHMGLPIVVLFVGFILLVGYPAFAGTIAGL